MSIDDYDGPVGEVVDTKLDRAALVAETERALDGIAAKHGERVVHRSRMIMGLDPRLQVVKDAKELPTNLDAQDKGMRFRVGRQLIVEWDGERYQPWRADITGPLTITDNPLLPVYGEQLPDIYGDQLDKVVEAHGQASQDTWPPGDQGTDLKPGLLDRLADWVDSDDGQRAAALFAQRVFDEKPDEPYTYADSEVVEGQIVNDRPQQRLNRAVGWREHKDEQRKEPDQDVVDAEVVEDPQTYGIGVDIGRDGSATVAIARRNPDGTTEVVAQAAGQATEMDGVTYIGAAPGEIIAATIEIDPDDPPRPPQTDEPASADVVIAPRTAVRMRPTGRECWFRLYSTPTSPLRSQQDHGVRDVTAYRDNPHLLTLWLDDDTTLDISALAYKINGCAPDTKLKAIASGEAKQIALRGPDSIDLLVEYPPQLPGRQRYWQQMTNPGQFNHPGDDRQAWRFADWFNGSGSQSQAFRFTERPSESRGPSMIDWSGEWVDLGIIEASDDE